MSTTSKNVKSRTGQPDAKNFIEKKIEIPEVLKAQQPEQNLPKKEPRKIERPYVVIVSGTTPTVVEQVKPIVLPVQEIPKVIEPIKQEPPKTKIVVESEPPVQITQPEPPVHEIPKIETVPPEMVLEKSVSNPLSIDSDDDNKEYGSFVKNIEDNTEKVKGKIASEIIEKGEVLLREIDAKKNAETVKKYKYIPYIIKHSEGKHTAEELLLYSLNDVKAIFLDIKQERESRSFFAKIARFFKFLFDV
jgi:hypothetical protein